MINLSVNVNKIALLRNSRGENNPNLIDLINDILTCGAHGITVHPRPDQRHVNYNDVLLIKDHIYKHFHNKEFNIEGNPFDLKSVDSGKYPGYLEMILSTIPDQATLVPDSKEQLTSDHGWNLDKSGVQLEKIIKKIKTKNIRVSLFLDVDSNSIKIAKDIGCDRIELYTKLYADCYPTKKRDIVYKKYIDKAFEINELGLELNAGHDLNQKNLIHFIKNLPYLKEISIGHALICESLIDGLKPTIKNYLQLLNYDLSDL